jgi:hypothetical protein
VLSLNDLFELLDLALERHVGPLQIGYVLMLGLHATDLVGVQLRELLWVVELMGIQIRGVGRDVTLGCKLAFLMLVSRCVRDALVSRFGSLAKIFSFASITVLALLSFREERLSCRPEFNIVLLDSICYVPLLK